MSSEAEDEISDAAGLVNADLVRAESFFISRPKGSKLLGLRQV